jgi:aryl-alcohol dehydrogenase-like predicted oxidoreductase
VEGLLPLARELGASLAQLALAWCLRRENVASVIVGATHPGQLEENAKACELRLPDEVLARIDALFPARGA